MHHCGTTQFVFIRSCKPTSAPAQAIKRCQHHNYDCWCVLWWCSSKSIILATSYSQFLNYYSNFITDINCSIRVERPRFLHLHLRNNHLTWQLLWCKIDILLWKPVSQSWIIQLHHSWDWYNNNIIIIFPLKWHFFASWQCLLRQCLTSAINFWVNFRLSASGDNHSDLCLTLWIKT